MEFLQQIFGACFQVYHDAGRPVVSDDFSAVRHDGRALPANPLGAQSVPETERSSMQSRPEFTPEIAPDSIDRLDKKPDVVMPYGASSAANSDIGVHGREEAGVSHQSADPNPSASLEPHEMNVFQLAANVAQQRGSSKAANYAYRYRLEKKLGPNFPNSLGPYFKVGQMHDFLEDSCLLLGPEYKACRWNA